MMMDSTVLIVTIVIGVATGLAANGFTWLFVTVLLPLYQNFTYHGVRVDGTWCLDEAKITADGGTLSTVWMISATLRQTAYRISGVATAISVRENKTSDVINYIVAGNIRDRFVSLHFHNQDEHRIAYSGFLLEIVGDGATMKGYRAFYGLKKQVIRSIESTWKRDVRDGRRTRDCHST